MNKASTNSKLERIHQSLVRIQKEILELDDTEHFNRQATDILLNSLIRAQDKVAKIKD